MGPWEIGRLNFRSPAASLTVGESLLRLFKLECQDPECNCLDWEYGCYKAVNKDCHTQLNESGGLMLQIEFPTPINLSGEMCWGDWDFFENDH